MRPQRRRLTLWHLRHRRHLLLLLMLRPACGLHLQRSLSVAVRLRSKATEACSGFLGCQWRRQKAVDASGLRHLRCRRAILLLRLEPGRLLRLKASGLRRKVRLETRLLLRPEARRLWLERRTRRVGKGAVCLLAVQWLLVHLLLHAWVLQALVKASKARWLHVHVHLLLLLLQLLLL